jgi:elongation factor 1-beta
MTNLLLTLKILPKHPEVDMEQLRKQTELIVDEFGAKLLKTEEEPMAFGLKALKIIVTFKEEDNPNVDILEEKLQALEMVSSTEVVDIRRAFG